MVKRMICGTAAALAVLAALTAGAQEGPAEGGLPRVVWMPQELKDEMQERFEKRLAEIGQPELLDKIASEKDAVSVEELVEFLQKAEHPALTMASVLG